MYSYLYRIDYFFTNLMNDIVVAVSAGVIVVTVSAEARCETPVLEVVVSFLGIGGSTPA